MPPEVSMRLAESRSELKAGTKQDIHEKDANHLVNAYNCGKYVARKFGWDIISCVEEQRLKSIDEIHEEIFSLIQPNIKDL